MDTYLLIGLLAFGTLGAVLVFALVSKRQIAARQRSDMPKSTLAADAPNTSPPGHKPVDT